jgi:NTE family protein
VGVLSVLEQHGVRVGCIAGTSMGAAVGALFASGYPVSRIEELVQSVDWQEVFSPRPERELVPLPQRIDLLPATLRVGLERGKPRLPQALQSDYRVNRMLTQLLAGPGLAATGDFDRLPIPFRAVATDLRTGARVVLDSGSLERAVRASLAYPPRLPPVEDPRGLLVDGGLVDNVPVDVVRAMGADLVIAVDTSLPPLPPEKYRDASGVLYKTVQILMDRRNHDFAEAADLTISPDLADVDEQDYGKHEHAIARGREAALQQLAGLTRISPASEHAITGTDGSSSRLRQPPASVDGRLVRRVSVAGRTFAREDLVSEVFGVRAGAPLALEAVLRGIDALQATRLFESIQVEMQPAGAEAVDLTLHLREAPRGVLELGAVYDEANDVSGFVRLRNRNLFGRGEDVSIAALASSGEVGLRATLAGDRVPGIRLLGYYGRATLLDERPRVFRGHELAGRAEFERRLVVAGVQRAIGPAVLLRAGLAGGRVDVEPRAALLSNASDRVWAAEASAVWDTLDDLWLPTRGGRLEITADHTLAGFGATHRYDRVSGRARGAFKLPIGVLQAELASSLSGGDVPVYDLFRLGGPVFLPGFHRDELWGRQAVAGTIAHSVDVASLRLTARVGAGGTFDQPTQIRLGALTGGFGLSVARDTPIGPIILGWGHSSQAGSRFYLSAGRALRF